MILPRSWAKEEAEAEEAMEYLGSDPRYEAACEGWATCAFLESVGGDDVHPEVEPVRKLHDEMTGVGSELPPA